ncbi:penicillin-binding protein 2 [Candidatus Finniella inopinata]|uniref:Penicillin-binding protein 2 n=1 Tax=Candidatus Finniella inopinata TaxID=1696036 RepID=A0A4Q7DHX9_9PROT|nr:penicillin-binding protein 2 [Candidatus Finniella inopinata]RZI45665.1 penicillin-binding protein 2 [Candidatus Finniella inopinata]
MKDKEQQQLFTRRSLILGGIQGGLALGLIGRLYVLQVVNSQHYQLLSDKNRIQSLDLLPARGEIFDRSGVLLAGNHTTYGCLLNLSKAKEVQSLLESLKSLIDIDAPTLERVTGQLKKQRKAFALLLKENLSWDELATLELHAPDLSGILIEKSQSRFYPHPQQTAHVVGYVGAVTEKEAAANDQLEIPGFKVGKTGLEKHEDDRMRGQPGLKRLEVNASQRVVRVLETVESVKGQDLHLTLDFPLQKAVGDILQRAQSACAVVLDVWTGAVLALVSHPTFDANLFIGGIGKTPWKDLNENPHLPMNNKVISGQYSPGSTFKMIVALAALKKGVVNSQTSFHCPGHYDFYDHRFHCWNWRTGGHGHMTLEPALSQSCDVYFYNLATTLGIDAMAETAREFGLGVATGIELTSEKAGLVPNKSWKRLIKKQVWTPGETINISIGQGAILATPIQLAKMTAMLANGLCPIQPHLLKNAPLMGATPLPYSKDFQNLIKAGMRGAVNEPRGNAYRARIEDPAKQMAGKTGSTQVVRITQQNRDNYTHNDRPYHLKEHALFVGYAPVDHPRFAVTVVVEHGGSGAKAAAPLARDILLAAQTLVV